MKVYKSEEAKFKAKKPVLTMADITPGQKKPATSLMPMFPKDVSGLPHSIARSALFSPIRRGRRQYRRQEIIASRDDVSISYTGEQLDMADSDVFLQAVRVAQGKPAGEVCLFERAAFLRSIGRAKSKQNYEWLKSSLSRMTTASVRVQGKKQLIETALVASHGHDDDSGRFFVRFTPESVKLFAAYGHIDMAKRKLIKHDFAKWLQGYVSSHERGQHFITVEKLYSWSNSTDELRFFKCKKLKPALTELQELKIIKAVEIVGNVVEWFRI